MKENLFVEECTEIWNIKKGNKPPRKEKKRNDFKICDALCKRQP